MVNLIDAEDRRTIVISFWPRGWKYIIVFGCFSLWFLMQGIESVEHFLAGGYKDWVYILLALLWMFMAVQIWIRTKEELHVTAETLSIRVFPMGWWRHYGVAHIKRIGLSELGKGAKGIAPTVAALSFDYRQRYVLFGRGLDRETAEQVLTLIREKVQLPQTSSTPLLQNSKTPVDHGQVR